MNLEGLNNRQVFIAEIYLGALTNTVATLTANQDRAYRERWVSEPDWEPSPEEREANRHLVAVSAHEAAYAAIKHLCQEDELAIFQRNFLDG
jgi:hypothetical protein